jgi:hypothetical protein
VDQTDDRSPPAPPEREPEPESVVYVWVPPSEEPEWQTRVGSVGRLIALVAAAALAVAVGVYQVGLALNQMIQGVMGK